MKTNHYKLRAKCASDIAEFISKCRTVLVWYKMKKVWKNLPDVHFEFKTELTQEELIYCIQDISDSHIMIRTLQKIRNKK